MLFLIYYIVIMVKNWVLKGKNPREWLKIPKAIKSSSPDIIHIVLIKGIYKENFYLKLLLKSLSAIKDREVYIQS